MAYFAHEAGDADLRTEIVRSTNQELEKIINSFLNTGYASGGLVSGGDYADPTAWTGTYLHIWFDESAGAVKVKARAETTG